MAAQSTDLIVISRAGTLFKLALSELAALLGGGGGSGNIDGGNASSVPASNIDGGTATP